MDSQKPQIYDLPKGYLLKSSIVKSISPTSSPEQLARAISWIAYHLFNYHPEQIKDDILELYIQRNPQYLTDETLPIFSNPNPEEQQLYGLHPERDFILRTKANETPVVYWYSQQEDGTFCVSAGGLDSKIPDAHSARLLTLLVHDALVSIHKNMPANTICAPSIFSASTSARYILTEDVHAWTTLGQRGYSSLCVYKEQTLPAGTEIFCCGYTLYSLSPEQRSKGLKASQIRFDQPQEKELPRTEQVILGTMTTLLPFPITSAVEIPVGKSQMRELYDVHQPSYILPHYPEDTPILITDNDPYQPIEQASPPKSTLFLEKEFPFFHKGLDKRPLFEFDQELMKEFMPPPPKIPKELLFFKTKDKIDWDELSNKGRQEKPQENTR
jgi:hypothetical protein